MPKIDILVPTQTYSTQVLISFIFQENNIENICMSVDPPFGIAIR